MAEINSDVFDVFHPTPIPLEDLGAIAVSIEIWRCKINEHRQRGTLAEFRPKDECASLQFPLPDLPSAIHTTVKEYLTIFGRSLANWLYFHWELGVHSCHKYDNHVLEDFDDFVCDYYGDIDYVRTAERMMCCDRFDVVEKFSIACNYFFEDDITRLWQLVAGKRKMNLNRINFEKHSLLYYWICRLTNQLDKIQITEGNDTLEEKMLNVFAPITGPSMAYFWSRVPMENRFMMTVSLLEDNDDVIRLILPKLGHQQLDKIINDDCSQMMCTMWWHPYNKKFVLGTWWFIRNIISERVFANVMVTMLDVDDSLETDERERKEYLRREIWNSAPSNLKTSVIRNISSDMLKRLGFPRHDYDFENQRYSLEINAEFLLIILQYASLEERTLFWHNHWQFLIAVVSAEDLPSVMTQCFANEDEMNRFKLNVMTTSDDVRKLCTSCLKEARFDKLNKLASFCHTELQTSSTFKQQLLRSIFLRENDILDAAQTISKFDEFNEFINEAYNDVDSSADFKNQLMSSPSTRLSLSKLIVLGKLSLQGLIKFVHTFVSSSPETTLTEIKATTLYVLKECTGSMTFCDPYYMSILYWCLGSDEEIREFRLTYFSGSNPANKK